MNKDFPKSVEMLRGIIGEANSKIKYYPYRSLEEITSRRDAKSITLEFKGKYGDELHIVDEDE